MPDETRKRTALSIAAPCSGTLHPLEHAPTNLHTLGLLGRGAFIRVSGFQLFVPFDARILTFSATGDLLKLQAANGLQLELSFYPSIHSLHGLRVKRHSDVGNEVAQGTCLMDFDPLTWRQFNHEIGLVITVLNPVKSIELNIPQATKGKQILALTDTLMSIHI